MPVKRRTDKARPFNDFHREMLFDGPEAMLLAGCGYMAGKGPAVFDLLDEAGKAEVLAEMRDDWIRRGPELRAEWLASGRAGEPWAATAFSPRAGLA